MGISVSSVFKSLIDAREICKKMTRLEEKEERRKEREEVLKVGHDGTHNMRNALREEATFNQWLDDFTFKSSLVM